MMKGGCDRLRNRETRRKEGVGDQGVRASQISVVSRERKWDLI
jgi:hypothetical protein